MATSPINNLPTAAQPWGRDVEDRIKTLENAINRLTINTNSSTSQVNSALKNLNLNVSKLNGAVQGLQNAKMYTTADPARPSGATSTVVSVAFTKPSWATTATVIANGEVGILGNTAASETISGNVRIDIDGSRPKDTNAGTGIDSEYYKYVTHSGSGPMTYAPMFHARTFTCNASSFTVSMIFEKSATTFSTFVASINAIVYWSA